MQNTFSFFQFFHWSQCCKVTGLPPTIGTRTCGDPVFERLEHTLNPSWSPLSHSFPFLLFDALGIAFCALLIYTVRKEPLRPTYIFVLDRRKCFLCPTYIFRPFKTYEQVPSNLDDTNLSTFENSWPLCTHPLSTSTIKRQHQHYEVAIWKWGYLDIKIFFSNHHLRDHITYINHMSSKPSIQSSWS